MDKSRSEDVIRASQANYFIAFHAVNVPGLSTLERQAFALEIGFENTGCMLNCLFPNILRNQATHLDAMMVAVIRANLGDQTKRRREEMRLIFHTRPWHRVV